MTADLKGYVVQPLSHPFESPPPVHLFREDAMRPWLAWSAPGFTHQFLNSLSYANMSYDMMDWRGLIVEKKYGDGDAQVDGSIMAARAIDSSYSLFSSMKTSAPEHGIQEKRWNGLYIGGEKLWLGEPARVRTGSGSDIIVLSEIIERTQNGFDGKPSTTVLVVGDLFQLSSVAPNQQPPSDAGLPFRMREDMKQRNMIAVAAHRPASYWKLLQPLARISVADLKGRWYEATVLLPILHGEEYPRRKAEGDVAEAGLYMNSRGDAQQDPSRKSLLNRKNDRLAACGRAVPQNMVIVEGIDPPGQEEMTAVFASMAGTGGDDSQQSEQHAEQVPIEEFMDFEKAGLEAYGNEFGSHFGGV